MLVPQMLLLAFSLWKNGSRRGGIYRSPGLQSAQSSVFCRHEPSISRLFHMENNFNQLIKSMCTIFFAGYRVRTLRKIYCRMFWQYWISSKNSFYDVFMTRAWASLQGHVGGSSCLKPAAPACLQRRPRPLAPLLSAGDMSLPGKFRRQAPTQARAGRRGRRSSLARVKVSQ